MQKNDISILNNSNLFQKFSKKSLKSKITSLLVFHFYNLNLNNASLMADKRSNKSRDKRQNSELKDFILVLFEIIILRLFVSFLLNFDTVKEFF